MRGEHFHLSNQDRIKMKMRGKGFEPLKALSQEILSLSRLTASVSSRRKTNNSEYKKVYKCSKIQNYETAIVSWSHLIPFRTQKLSSLRSRR